MYKSFKDMPVWQRAKSPNRFSPPLNICPKKRTID
jgi:hypothetical protein